MYVWFPQSRPTRLDILTNDAEWRVAVTIGKDEVDPLVANRVRSR
jgi:hypothetical protein